jgi:hypothetical protein
LLVIGYSFLLLSDCFAGVLPALVSDELPSHSPLLCFFLPRLAGVFLFAPRVILPQNARVTTAANDPIITFSPGAALRIGNSL